MSCTACLSIVPVRGLAGKCSVHSLGRQDEVVRLLRLHSLSFSLGKGGVQPLHLLLALGTPAGPATRMQLFLLPEELLLL